MDEATWVSLPDEDETRMLMRGTLLAVESLLVPRAEWLADWLTVCERRRVGITVARLELGQSLTDCRRLLETVRRLRGGA